MLKSFKANHKKFYLHYRSCLLLVLLLGLATAVAAFFFHSSATSSANITLAYALAVVLIARVTDGYFYGILAAVAAVLSVNFLFTYPYFELNFTLTGYPVTFVGMLAITMISSAAATNIKEQARIINEREKVIASSEKERMRANLLRAVSHDLRTPLTSIIGASSSYLETHDTLSGEEKLELVRHIQEDSNWLLNMVENLLSVTRINNQNASVATSLEPIEEVLSEAVSRFRKRYPDTPVKVAVPDEFLMVPMDAMLIEQVIINLLENAAVHSHSSRPVSCFVENSDNYVIFHIRDYGTGVDPDKLETIFDGASSGDCQSDSRRGMGIGLSICKTIITAHKGKIEALNHADGAEFCFTLPKEEIRGNDTKIYGAGRRG